MSQPTNLETLAQRLTEAVTLAARDHGYRPKKGRTDTAVLRDSIADWLEENMEPRRATVRRLLREKVEA